MGPLFTFLPADQIFPVPIADPYSPLSTVTLRWDEGGTGIDGTLAADFPIVQAQIEDIQLQFGVTAVTLMGFSADGELTFGLQTFDGLFAFPVDFSCNGLHLRGQWTHHSAHYGDGIRHDGNKPTNTGSWSREFWQLQAGYSWRMLHPYLGVRYIAHDTNELPPLGLQAGLEVEGPWRHAPFGAVDLKIASEHDWYPGVAAQVGWVYKGEYRRFRLAVSGRAGPDDTGKYSHLNERYIGVVFGFDSTGALWRGLSELPEGAAP